MAGTLLEAAMLEAAMMEAAMMAGAMLVGATREIEDAHREDVSDHVRVGADHHVGHHQGHVHDQSGSCGHDHTSSPRGLSWIGILIGLWLHTMIDGVALAASAVADAQHAGIALAGLGTFLAIALHKPLDAFAITSTMRTSGWPPLHQGIINVVFAIACPVGALLFYFGVTRLTNSSLFLGWGLAISAGFFICISLADLLPEVSFHHHDRGKLTLSLFLGIALAFAVENLPGHSHIHAGQESPKRQSVARALDTVDSATMADSSLALKP